MKPLLIILDDWEGRIQASTCWNHVKELVEIKFLNVPIEDAADAEIKQALFLMAVRERTTLDEHVFKRMADLKLVLQTGGHAYHIDESAAQNQNIVVALGRRVKAPLISVPELTLGLPLALCTKCIGVTPQCIMGSGNY